MCSSALLTADLSDHYMKNSPKPLVDPANAALSLQEMYEEVHYTQLNHRCD